MARFIDTHKNVTATTTGDPSFFNFHTNVDDAIYRTQNIM